MPDLPIIELRRIEAGVIEPIYEEMTEHPNGWPSSMTARDCVS